MSQNNQDITRPLGENIRTDSIPNLLSWIDISIPLHNNMVHWPGDAPFQVERVKSIEKGDHNNLSRISMGSHTGTHMDAPLHFIRDGKDISSLPLDTVIGNCRVIEIKDPHSINKTELIEYQLQIGERVLFKTLNSTRVWNTEAFVEDFVAISREAADFLVHKSLKLVGVDYLSAGKFHADGADVHRALLGGDIWIIEGLNLSQVKPGKYFLICLPLKIPSGDGAPVRAVLRKIPE